MNSSKVRMDNQKGEKKINILYVDDEENSLISFLATFRKYFNILTANSVAAAEKLLAENEIHVLITDQRMPGTNGTQLLAQASLKHPDQMRILLTGYYDIEALKSAVNEGHIFKYLQKPWNENELKETIEMAYRHYVDTINLKKKARELMELKRRFDKEMDDLLKKKLGL